MRDPLVVVAMLRFIVLIALVAGSIQAAPLSQTYPFQNGKTAVYRYNFQHVFADPRYAKVFAMLTVHSHAHFTPIGNDWIVLRMKNISMGPLQSKITYPDPIWRMVAEERSVGIFNSIIKEIIGKLEIPIKFQYKHGIVLMITKNSNDVDESVNIKRGLISLFEVNFEDVARGLNSKASSDIPRPIDPVYLEKTVQGLCKTRYIVTKDKLPTVPMRISVLKTIDTDKCIITPTSQKGLISTYRGKNCEPKLKMMETRSTVRYSIRKVSNILDITRVIAESSYNLLLNSPSEGRIALSLNQTLRLLAYKEEAVPTITATINTDLIAEIPKHNKAAFPVKEIADRIILMLRGDVDAKSVNDIILLCEQLEETHLMKIWESTVERRNLVVNIFTKVDTVLMRVFLRRVLLVLIQEFPSCLPDIALFQSPDTEFLKELLSVFKTGRLSEDRRRHLVLNIGAYANKFVVLYHRIDKEIRQGDKLVKQALVDMVPYLENLKVIEKLWQSEKLRKQAVLVKLTTCLDLVTELLEHQIPIEPIYALKAFGNMGYHKTIETLLRIVKSTSQPEIVRINAVDSLRKMVPRSFYEKIQMPLFELYTNMRESKVLRTRVFLLLTKYELSESMILALLLTHQKTAPEYVGAFVYKYLSEISKSKFYPLRNMTIKADKVVTAVEPIMPMHLKERMSIPTIYEGAHKLLRRMSSLLVWHFSTTNVLSLSSAALDVQIIPGIMVPETSVILRARSSSLATYDDIEVEVTIPLTITEIMENIKLRNWTVLNEINVVLKRNDLVLYVLSKKTVICSLPEILSLIWNVNQRIIPTSAGGFLRVEQKSTIVARNPISPSTENMTLSSECHVNTYIDAYYLHVGGGMKTSVKLFYPGKMEVSLLDNKLTIKSIVKPKKVTINPVSLEQVPFTLMRMFLPLYEKEQLVDLLELPIVLAECATDVNYLETMGNFAMRAQLPMADRYPQDIISAVWYGIHSINLYYRDATMAEKSWLLQMGGRLVKESESRLLEVFVKVNDVQWTSTIRPTIVPSETSVICRIAMVLTINDEKKTITGEISIPKRKPIEAKCLFSEEYQTKIRSLLRKVDTTQPCLLRSQIETLVPKYTRVWNKLISLGLLNFDENEHNIISELRPELITKSLKLELVEQFFVLLNISKMVKEFNEAAFHPLYLLNGTLPSMNMVIVEAHKNLSIIIEEHLKLSVSENLLNSTYHFAILYEMLSIHTVNVRIFTEALYKISSLHEVSNTLRLPHLDTKEKYRMLVAKFNKDADPLIEEMIENGNDKSLFKKIQEVEELLMRNSAESSLIQWKANELLTLIPLSFDPESKVTEILFLRARHLVSGSIVFKTPVTTPFNDTVYEFWQLRQDIVMYYTLRHETIDILPCEGQSHKLLCKMLGLVSKEFYLFHYAASYKRLAVRYFNSKDSDYVHINRLMKEFDNLLQVVRSISSGLKLVTSNEKAILSYNSSVEVVRSWYRLTTGLEWSVKLLDEYRSIWHNIKEYGMAERAIKLDAMKQRIVILWNNLKVKESCKSVWNWEQVDRTSMIVKECALPESMTITSKIWLNSEPLIQVELTGKKSLEQLLHDHNQFMPGFRTETTYRYLEKTGLGISNSVEEYNILYNINVYRDLKINTTVFNLSPMAEEMWIPVEKFVTKCGRWLLRKHWVLEDLKLANVAREIIQLPTIQIIQYMGMRMADILVIRPSLTESFLEVPILTLPIMHWPVLTTWSEQITPSIVWTTLNTTEWTTQTVTKLTGINVTEWTTQTVTKLTGTNATEWTTRNGTEWTTRNATKLAGKSGTEWTTPNATELTGQNATKWTVRNGTKWTVSTVSGVRNATVLPITTVVPVRNATIPGRA